MCHIEIQREIWSWRPIPFLVQVGCSVLDVRTVYIYESDCDDRIEPNLNQFCTARSIYINALLIVFCRIPMNIFCINSPDNKFFGETVQFLDNFSEVCTNCKQKNQADWYSFGNCIEYRYLALDRNKISELLLIEQLIDQRIQKTNSRIVIVCGILFLLKDQTDINSCGIEFDIFRIV